MRLPLIAIAVGALLVGAVMPAVAAPPGHNGWGQDRGAGYHWRRGQRMGYNDWRSAPPVDYRARHLRAPPRGYEWRQVNGQYVLAAAATGLIASIIAAGAH
jgi:Ni/Co efflux regulator RcnB